MRKVVMSPQGKETEVLRVPFHFQGDKDFYCVPFSLLMAIQYFGNIYEDDYINKNTPSINLDDMLKICRTRYLGTIVSQKLIDRLNDAFPTLHFNLVRNYTVDDLLKRFGKNLPSIALYDCSYLTTEIPGAHHAGVVVGFINDDNIVLNNPWLGPFRPVDLLEFNQSWELEGNQAIEINPKAHRELEVYDANNSK